MAEDAARITYRDEASGKELTFGGTPGDSLLDIALRNGFVIEHTCGGVGACSTCHVVVKEGGSLLSAAQDSELDRLEEAPGVRLESRLACQAKIVQVGVVVCVIPTWNRNVVRESK